MATRVGKSRFQVGDQVRINRDWWSSAPKLEGEVFRYYKGNPYPYTVAYTGYGGRLYYDTFLARELEKVHFELPNYLKDL